MLARRTLFGARFRLLWAPSGRLWLWTLSGCGCASQPERTVRPGRKQRVAHQRTGSSFLYPEGPTYTTIMELGPRNQNRDGFLGA